MHSEQIMANKFIQCASSTRWSPECAMYMCYYVILSPSPPPRCPSGYFGPRCLQPEPLRLRMPKPSESMLTWEAQLHTEDRSPAVTTSVALLSCVPEVLTVGRFGLCGSRCCSCSNFMFSLLSSLFFFFFAPLPVAFLLSLCCTPSSCPFSPFCGFVSFHQVSKWLYWWSLSNLRYGQFLPYVHFFFCLSVLHAGAVVLWAPYYSLIVDALLHDLTDSVSYVIPFSDQLTLHALPFTDGFFHVKKIILIIIIPLVNSTNYMHGT